MLLKLTTLKSSWRSMVYFAVLFVGIEAEIEAFGVAGIYVNQPQSINVVQLTQKGYNQFLKYTVDVPPLTEYTFCVWILSNNLHFAHPILSYSKYGEKRLIRFWISPSGYNFHLEILGQEVFEFPVFLHEHVWYHICQSWSGYEGAWHLFFNGKLIADGVEPKLAGTAIPGGGDIVVGQEYTDVEKGYEDGIEGDVYGFNIVLASTINLNIHPLTRRNSILKLQPIPPNQPYRIKSRRNTNFPKLIEKPSADRRIIATTKRTTGKVKFVDDIYPVEQPLITPTKKTISPNELNPSVGYFAKPVTRKPRGFLEVIRDMFDFFTPTGQRVVKTIDQFNHEESRKLQMMQHHMKPFRPSPLVSQTQLQPVRVRGWQEGHRGGQTRNLGVLLVELTFKNCALMKGAPLSGEKVLVSWTKSTVRVYGGAMFHDVLPFCFVA